MQYQDDRTTQQKDTHVWGVRMYDAFMSGWGGARSGASVAVWACPTHMGATVVQSWVRNRGEARRVEIIDLRKHRPARGVAHFHVYVVNDGHPSLRDTYAADGTLLPSARQR